MEKWGEGLSLECLVFVSTVGRTVKHGGASQSLSLKKLRDTGDQEGGSTTSEDAQPVMGTLDWAQPS